MTQSAPCPQCGAPLPPDAPEGICPKCLMGAALDRPAGDELPETTPPTPPGGRFVPPKSAELAKHFPQLEILDLIGHGGMGAVYKARQRELDRIVALKILPPGVSEDPAFAERFTREAKTLAKMNHPHIVGIHDVGQRGGYYFFVMEYVDGVDVRQAIQAKTLSPAEALTVVTQICDALHYAHGLGIVHRDIKPENVLIDKQGQVKIADFGLAKILAKAPTDITLTQDHQVMGTPQYMAPEQLRRPLEVDHRADIYSLGVVFYELLTGDVPMGRFDPPSKRVQVDVRLDEVVLRALEQEPDRRYQQVSEIKTKVQTISGMSPQALQGVVRAMGREYKSKANLFGLPLLHVATGFDPKTGRKRVAKGVIALGDVAVGVFAAGGVAMGGVTFGGVSLGLISLGGLALSLLLAVGGLAIGGVAFGGMACGIVAIGGGAVGFYAAGGGAWGVHVASSAQVDPAAHEFFQGWGENWPKWLTLIGIFTPLGMALLGLSIWLALRSGRATSGWDEGDDHLAEGKHRRHGQRAFESHGDQSGFVCAILALVMLMTGLVVPVILLGVLPTRAIAGLTFAIAMFLALVLGLIGHRYRMGCYTALVSLLLLLLSPLTWYFLAAEPSPDRKIDSPEIRSTPAQPRDSETQRIPVREDNASKDERAP